MTNVGESLHINHVDFSFSGSVASLLDARDGKMHGRWRCDGMHMQRRFVQLQSPTPKDTSLRPLRPCRRPWPDGIAGLHSDHSPCDPYSSPSPAFIMMIIECICDKTQM